MDNMGAGPQGVLTDSVLGNNPTLPGATGGAQTVTLTQGNVPAYTLSGGSGSVSVSGTTNGESQSHTHSISGTTGGEGAHAHNYTDASDKNAFALVAAPDGTGQAGFWRGAFTNSTTAGTIHTHTFSATSGNASQGHNHTFSAAGTASSISISSGGSGSAVSKLPPLMTFMIYIRL
jgi:hypothetical protein